MKEEDLNTLFQSKRETPTTVPVEQVGTWLASGIATLGFFATIKWLFTQKIWIMLTSISTITVATCVAVLSINTPKPNKAVEKEKIEHAFSNNKIVNEISAPEVLESNIPRSEEKEEELPILETRMLQLIPGGIDYIPEVKQTKNENETEFTRIKADGLTKFTLVQGDKCEVKTKLTKEDNVFTYQIENGKLTLNSSGNEYPSDIIVMVKSIESIRLNGDSEIVMNERITSPNLSVRLNGTSSATLKIDCDDFELELEGMSQANLDIVSDKSTIRINGMSALEATTLVEQLDLNVNGNSTSEFAGSVKNAVVEVNGMSDFDAVENTILNMEIVVSGESKAHVNVIDFLDCEANGISKLYYKVEPKKIIKMVSGNSKIKQKG